MISAKRTRPDERRRRRAITRLAKLLRRRSVRNLRSLAAQRGIRLWIVGGSLRDALDGRAPAELDVAVSHDCAGLVAAMEAAGAGTVVPLSDASPRVFRIAGADEIDCAEIEGGSIESDMARRDFTVNAMAFDPESRIWIDPYDGAADLARRRLRLVSAANLSDDPLRALRVARFVATHGLRPDAEALRVIRAVAPRLREVAPERIRVELLKTLQAAKVQRSLEVLLRTGLLEPALRRAVVAAMPGSLLRRFDAPGIGRLPLEDRGRLRLAMLAVALHLSPADAASWLADLRFSRADCADVAALMTLADGIRHLRTSREAWGWVRDAGSRRALALQLFALLHPAQARRAKSLGRLRPRRRRRFAVSGRDILAWLGIPPGPRVGQLLRELEIEELRGDIRSRAAARRWLLQQQKKDFPALSTASPAPYLTRSKAFVDER